MEERTADDLALAGKVRELHDHLLHFGLEVARPRGHLREDLVAYRSSASHRAAAVRWHVLLLFDCARRHHRRMNESPQTILELHDDPRVEWQVRRELLFVFDDVIFNGLSLFDYLAHLFEAVFVGEAEEFSWAKLASATTRVTSTSYPERLLGAVAAADSRLVTNLRRLRNKVIHETAQSAVATRTLNLEALSSTVRVEAPETATGYFPQLAGLDILSSAEVLGSAVLTEACLVASAARASVTRN
jgi:hypothetical protein